jgi:hypothetical protein
MIFSDPRTQKTELQVQKIINLYNAINNLSDAFIDYNDAMKSCNHVINAPKQVEISKKTTLTPSTEKGGRVETTRKNIALEKRTRKEKSKVPRKFKNVI